MKVVNKRLNKILLHVEGFIVLVLSLLFYYHMDFSWLLLFVPDFSALGYVINQHVGAIVYNIFHTYSFPFVMIIFNMWIAHIGMDRMGGYGLKYPTKFQDTHLDRV